MKILCTDHYFLWMKWVRAKSKNGKAKAKDMLNKHIEICSVCQEKLKNK